MKRSIYLAAFTTLTLACGGAPDSGGVNEVASTKEAIFMVGSPGEDDAWDSGDTSNTTTTSLNCSTSSDRVINRLRGFVEPVSNLDNFIARLDLGCQEYTGSNGFYSPGTEFSIVTIYQNSFRTPGVTIITPVEENRVAVGVRLTLNGGEDYVQNMQILNTKLKSNGAHDTVSATVNRISDYNGDTRDVKCDNFGVLTGLRIRHANSSGKIRSVGVRCTRVAN